MSKNTDSEIVRAAHGLAVISQDIDSFAKRGTTGLANFVTRLTLAQGRFKEALKSHQNLDAMTERAASDALKSSDAAIKQAEHLLSSLREGSDVTKDPDFAVFSASEDLATVAFQSVSPSEQDTRDFISQVETAQRLLRATLRGNKDCQPFSTSFAENTYALSQFAIEGARNELANRRSINDYAVPTDNPSHRSSDSPTQSTAKRNLGRK